MTAQEQAYVGRADETPDDVFGPGFIIHCLREDFIDLCRLVGFENARAEIAEIIESERIGDRRHG